MSFLDDAKTVFDQGVGAAGAAFDTVASAAKDFSVEQLQFVRDFGILCTEGAAMGWHEANGGNVSYRLTQADIAACMSAFDLSNNQWVDLGVSAPDMGDEMLMVTASGCQLRLVQKALRRYTGIVEINSDGDAYRVVWGWDQGGMPTSELASHVLIHQARKKATSGRNRVLYHTHPANIVALSLLLPPEAKTITRVLWGTMTESIIVAPQGVGAVGWMVPGSLEIAAATAEQMDKYGAVIWSQHGLFASGATFEEAYGVVEALDKTAGIYLTACAANGGAEPLYQVKAENLREIADRYDLDISFDLLD